MQGRSRSRASEGGTRTHRSYLRGEAGEASRNAGVAPPSGTSGNEGVAPLVTCMYLRVCAVSKGSGKGTARDCVPSATRREG